MNIKRVGFAFIVIAMTVGCASTLDTESQKTIQGTDTVQGTEPVQVAGTEAYDPDEITCKRIAKTGTRVKSKVCATNAEWKASEEYAQKATKEMQRRPGDVRDAQ
mgnify:CR=1 FL=1